MSHKPIRVCKEHRDSFSKDCPVCKLEGARNEIVPTENSVQPMTGVIPPNEPQSSSGLRPCLNLVTEIFRWAFVQGSAVQTEISKRQG